MFNRTVINGGPSRVDVFERRAPTDESVRLLREMEASAREEVVESYRMEGNGFSGVLQRSVDFASDTVVLRCVFELNGRRFTEEADAPGWKAEKGWKAENDLMIDLRDKVAVRIANEILKAAWAKQRI